MSRIPLDIPITRTRIVRTGRSVDLMRLGFAEPTPDRAKPISDALALLPFRLEILDCAEGVSDSGKPTLRVRISVSERGTGLPIEPIVTVGLEDGDRVEAVRTALLHVLAHELDECLVYRDMTPVRETHEADGTSVAPRIPAGLVGEPDDPKDDARAAVVLATVDMWAGAMSYYAVTAGEIANAVGRHIAERLKEAGLV